jgi:5-methyltetrahydropteroyltriglutamate--homocysteine methyltransferase
MALAAPPQRGGARAGALGVDVIQLDEPAFNVYMDEVRDWGIEALNRAWTGSLPTVVHICYGYGIKANTDWKKTLGGEWRQYGADLSSPRDEPHRRGVSRMCQCPGTDVADRPPRGQGHSRGCRRRGERPGETPEEVAAVIRAAMQHVKPSQIYPCTNCGMVPLDRELARAKLRALGAGAPSSAANSLSRRPLKTAHLLRWLPRRTLEVPESTPRVRHSVAAPI